MVLKVVTIFHQEVADNCCFNRRSLCECSYLDFGASIERSQGQLDEDERERALPRIHCTQVCLLDFFKYWLTQFTKRIIHLVTMKFSRPARASLPCDLSLLLCQAEKLLATCGEFHRQTSRLFNCGKLFFSLFLQCQRVRHCQTLVPSACVCE